MKTAFGVYVHWPFCLSKCPYCDFNSHVRHAAIDEVAHSLEPLLEMYERDEAEGRGDMPYPPDYPKMPGEPKRVQPSRDRDRKSPPEASHPA